MARAVWVPDLAALASDGAAASRRSPRGAGLALRLGFGAGAWLRSPCGRWPGRAEWPSSGLSIVGPAGISFPRLFLADNGVRRCGGRR